MSARKLPAGTETLPEFYMRFALWAKTTDRFLSAETVCNHFDVSRATAFRWLRAWNNAKRALVTGDL